MPFLGAQERPEATDALAGWEYTLGFIMSNKTADLMAGSGRE
jgi:hypothetical protein